MQRRAQHLCGAHGARARTLPARRSYSSSRARTHAQARTSTHTTHTQARACPIASRSPAHAAHTLFSSSLCQAIGHKHVLVNGKVVNSTHYLLKPGDVLEPRPGSEHIWFRNARRRLANNNFVFKKDGPPSKVKQLTASGSNRTPMVSGELDALAADGARMGAAYRRLPPPRSATDDDAPLYGDAPAASKPAGWPAARQAQLDAIVPAMVCALAGEGTAIEAGMAKRRTEVTVLAPPGPASAATLPPATLAWQPPTAADGEAPKALLSLDRSRLRKLMLGLLALRPLGGSSGRDSPF